MTGGISIASKDRIKDINDFKLCTLFLGSNTFEYDDSTADTRGFQQVLKYGTHKLSANFRDNSSLRNRDNPFSATLGFMCAPDSGTARAKRKGDGGAASDLRGRLWYFPFENKIETTNNNYGDTGTLLRIYYWDYRKDERRWIKFTDAAIQTPGNEIDILQPIVVPTVDGDPKGIYVRILNDTIAGFSPGDWDDYIDGTGGAAWAETPNEPDPAICIETVSDLTDHNPVRIMHDLLTSPRFVNLDETVDAGPIDVSTTDFSGIPDDTYSWDRAFEFFDDDNGEINVGLGEQTSIKKILEEIVKVTGMFFFQSANKSTTQDRSIRLELNKTVNPCDAAQESTFLAGSFSTTDFLRSYNTEISNDGLRDKVINVNFDSGKSTRKQFDIKIRGTGTRVLQLGSTSKPFVYFYDSGIIADAVASRKLAQLSEPAEIMRVTVDSAGFPVELSDLIKLHDTISGTDVIVQVFEHGFDPNNFSTKIQGRRYSLLYGPDKDNPFKLWAFVDCAFVDNDAIAGKDTGSGDVTIGSPKFELSSGTFDIDLIKVGMAVTINAQQHRVLVVVDDGELTLDGNSTETTTIANWSIGNSYHVF